MFFLYTYYVLSERFSFTDKLFNDLYLVKVVVISFYESYLVTCKKYNELFCVMDLVIFCISLYILFWTEKIIVHGSGLSMNNSSIYQFMYITNVAIF